MTESLYSSLDPAGEAPLHDVLARRFTLSIDVPDRFFRSHAKAVALACHAMAQRFERGGRLLVFGAGPQASDAAHVAVEFVHPVLVGKRALPAIAIPCDAATLGPRLELLGRETDIAMALNADGRETAAAAGLALARSRGMLTLALTGRVDADSAWREVADHHFVVDADDPLVIQETHETLYHVLWELVHLFFDQGGPLPESVPHCALCADEALPSVIRSVNPATRTAEVERCDAVQVIALDLVESVRVGDTVLVHQGFAIARVGDP